MQYRFFDKSFQESSHCYVKKDVDELQRNCFAITTALSGNGLFVMKQVHGVDVLSVDAQSVCGLEPEVDALVTDKPGLVLGIQTADCVSILLACETGKVVGAAHAGWKSAKDGIVANLVKSMRNIGANEIVAIIGPAIKQESYEVGVEYYEDFMQLDPRNARFFIAGKAEDKMLFDLPGYVYAKLTDVGITAITMHEEDTYSNKSKYHSYRRSCHTGEPYNGSLLSTIMISI